MRYQWRLLLALSLGFLIFIQLVAFSPTRLERDMPPAVLTEERILQDVKTTTAIATAAADEIPKVNIPQDQVPEYTVDGFRFVSTQAGVKQWRIEADHAFFYQKAGFVHARGVKAQIYDRAGNVTHVTSREAKYDLNVRDLELFTDVKSIFPEGLRTESPYMKYDAKLREVQVPLQVPITGLNPGKKNEDELAFESHGLTFQQDTKIVDLHSRVRTEARRMTKDGKREVTTIESDLARLDRTKGLVVFRMRDNNGKIELVRISQPGMFARARRAEFRFTGARELRTVQAIEEVKIEELPKPDPKFATDPTVRAPTPRYATAGLAEFDSLRNVIVLKQFPQVYQDRDTITGEVIILHRGSDLIEVQQSNAFSEGSELSAGN